MRLLSNLPQLHVVDASDDRTVSLGKRQAEWLAEHGHITSLGLQGDIHRYECKTMTATELDQFTISIAEIRECDICRAIPTQWKVRMRRWRITLGPMPGWVERPYFLCDECRGLVERNEKQALVTRAIEKTTEYALAEGGELAAIVRAVPRHRIREQLTPLVRECVYGMFGHREGRPERV